MSSLPCSFFLLLLLLLHTSEANLQKSKLLRPRFIVSDSGSDPPNSGINSTPATRFFEVTKPIKKSNVKPCSYTVLQHDFGATYGHPPVTAAYTPPSLSNNCPFHEFEKITMEWEAASKGRQFDRIFGVWLAGVELLRSCTAEPRPNGIVWSVEKDVTRYYSLLMEKNQTLAVYLGNLIDSTYTGVYHVNITFRFYPPEQKIVTNPQKGVEKAVAGYGGSNADLILPISRNLPSTGGGLWFEIENATDIQSKGLRIPQNAYRAVLEVYVSFHENDEFWYSNFPNDYIQMNNLSSTTGNGPFREVLVSLDGDVVGAIWPFTVIYTGGVNPLLWRPISGIGSFDLPSYDIEITPLLGKILDGKTHVFGFGVTHALNVWYVNANLHLWLDDKSSKTEGKVFLHKTQAPTVSLESKFKGLDGSFFTGVRRYIASSGWVKSSFGKITTKSIQKLRYRNKMVMKDEGNLQIVDQVIHSNDNVIGKSVSFAYSSESIKRFPLYLYSKTADQGNRSSLLIANLTLGFNEKKFRNVGRELWKSSLENVQNGQGSILVKNNLVVSGLGSTQEAYSYRSDELCYSRDVKSSNYTILSDKVVNTCDHTIGNLI